MADFVRRVPEGDDRERLVCPDCGHVAYENPKIVVGAVVSWRHMVLLCRRAIEPRRGFWTLPAGYLELGETVEEGAMREAWEEARARISLEGILGVFSISRIGQVQILFRARFTEPEPGGGPSFAAGPESLDVGLFSWEDIPWKEVAFPTVRWALEAWRASGDGPLGQPRGNGAEDPRGVRRIDARAPTSPA
jgi:ADP-ribose pyrophosphatase YjhB (NUDIX family)